MQVCAGGRVCVGVGLCVRACVHAYVRIEGGGGGSRFDFLSKNYNCGPVTDGAAVFEAATFKAPDSSALQLSLCRYLFNRCGIFIACANGRVRPLNTIGIPTMHGA